jgi:tRNA splicing endonuclease
MARQTKNSAEIDRILGKSAEPKYEKLESQSEISAALNWYHSSKDAKTSAKYISDYAKKHKIKGKLDTSKTYVTIGFLCRIVASGTILPEATVGNLKQTVTELMSLDESKTTEDTKKVPVVTIQDRLAEKVSEVAGELEGAIDDYITSEFSKQTSPFGIMHDRVKAMHATRLIEIFRKRRAEFDEVLSTDDSLLKEGYSNFSKPELKKMVAYCDLIITDAMKLSEASKLTRKPRKRKAVSADQLVAKVQFCESNDELKLKSELPKSIIGATQLWVFNVKTRKLGVYHALDAGGFSIKGTSLLNFSEMKSVQKTLRKPEAILPEIVKGSKVFLRNVIESVRAKESCLNGRLNRDTILLKVVK